MRSPGSPLVLKVHLSPLGSAARTRQYRAALQRIWKLFNWRRNDLYSRTKRLHVSGPSTTKRWQLCCIYQAFTPVKYICSWLRMRTWFNNSEFKEICSDGNVDGIEQDPGAIQFTSKQFASVKYIAGNISSLPFAYDTFHMAYSHQVFQFADDPVTGHCCRKGYSKSFFW